MGEKASEGPPLTCTCLPGDLPSEWREKQHVPSWTSEGLQNPPTGHFGGRSGAGGLWLCCTGQTEGLAICQKPLPQKSNLTLELKQSCHSTSIRLGKVKKGIFGLTVNSEVLRKKMILQQFKEKNGVFTFFPLSCWGERSTEYYFDNRN